MARLNEFKLTIDKQLEVSESHNSGVSIKDILKIYNISLTTLYRYLKKTVVKNPRWFRVYNFNQQYFNLIDTQEKAYWLGFLYADGYNNVKKGIVEIALKWEDKNILEKLKINLAATNKIRVKMSNGFKQCLLKLSSRYISDQLNNLGMRQNKSLILKFPTEEQVPSHLTRHFIRGYFDGDGCFGEYKRGVAQKRYVIDITTTKVFCESLKSILKNELNIYTGVVLRNKNKKNNGVTSSLHISAKKSVFSFLEWIYKDATVYLDRKYKKYIESLKNQMVKIETV